MPRRRPQSTDTDSSSRLYPRALSALGVKNRTERLIVTITLVSLAAFLVSFTGFSIASSRKHKEMLAKWEDARSLTVSFHVSNKTREANSGWQPRWESPYDLCQKVSGLGDAFDIFIKVSEVVELARQRSYAFDFVDEKIKPRKGALEDFSRRYRNSLSKELDEELDDAIGYLDSIETNFRYLFDSDNSHDASIWANSIKRDVSNFDSRIRCISGMSNKPPEPEASLVESWKKEAARLFEERYPDRTKPSTFIPSF